MRPAEVLPHPLVSDCTPASGRKSMVRSTSCASMVSMLLRKIESTNGSPRSCCAGADKLTVTSGSADTVIDCDALLSDGFGSDALLVTMALTVTEPAVSGAVSEIKPVRDWPTGKSPREKLQVSSAVHVTGIITCELKAWRTF